MEMQVEAERKKRAQILESEGKKRAQILESEGNDSTLLFIFWLLLIQMYANSLQEKVMTILKYIILFAFLRKNYHAVHL
jgi:hypothetical protein